MIGSSQIEFVRAQRGLIPVLLADLIPQWSAYLTAFDHCQRQRSHITEAAAAARATTANPVSRLADHVLDGQPFPDAFVEDIVSADHIQTSLERACRIVDQVERHLVGQLDEDVRRAPDRILSALDTRLQRIVARASQIELGTTWSADDAVIENRLTEWAEFAALDKEHDSIRDAQQQVMRGLSLSGIEHLATFGYFREYAAAFPDWPYWRADGEPVSTRHDDTVERIYARAPWPDGPARFRWLVDHPDIAVWVPTPTQLLNAVRSAHQARREPNPAERRAEADRITREGAQRGMRNLVG